MAQDIQVRVQGGEWAPVTPTDAKQFLRKSDFVYHYDAIATSADRIDILDLAIPAFLGAVPRFSKVLGALSKDASRLQVMSESLDAIPRNVQLWDYPDLAENRKALKQLFYECQMPHYGVASFTKMLHLKRPLLLPIIDNLVRNAWVVPNRAAWITDDLVDIVFSMKKHLSERRETLSCLRGIANELGSPWSGLSDLRLYDVLAYQVMFRNRSDTSEVTQRS